MQRLTLLVLKYTIGVTALFLIESCSGPASNRFESEIQAFEKDDSGQAYPNDLVLFIGSSSIRMWTTLKADFPGVNVLNRGFGGSEASDAVFFFDRIVSPYNPKKILFYEGDNDIANGKTADHVLRDFQNFAGMALKSRPDMRIGFISIKPSPSRWGFHEEMERANMLIKGVCERNPNLEFLDVYTQMIGDDGKPVSLLYLSDSLHMTREGYKIWKDVVSPFVYNALKVQEQQ